MAKITRLPSMQRRRRRIDLNEGLVRCQVSSRWLKFAAQGHKLPEGTFLIVDVMTSPDNLKPRKLCELVLTREDLMHVLERVTVD
jgi:hypothetical protein